MQQRQFAAKDIIFREGEPSDHAYYLLDGRVEILKSGPNGEVSLAILEPGSPFGEMGLLDASPRSASARALDAVTVEVIDRRVFEDMVIAIPPPVGRMIQAMIDRLRSTNQRVTSSEQATVLLESDIRVLRIVPGSERVANLVQAAEVPVARLPYRIGGYPEDGEPNRYDQNHLYIASEGPPLIVSRNHAAIEIDEGKIVFLDRGSRFGSLVNGHQIGRGRGVYKAPLAMGENEIVLGAKGSEYKLKVICE
ncbi:MAG: cyclic nucleotide-binding domain-containing protein [Alphaproteobacteria bacterium]|nr:cyclic nucleotide-binding domain-containing protein [Alphaproteobacteria bacterium]